MIYIYIHNHQLAVTCHLYTTYTFFQLGDYTSPIPAIKGTRFHSMECSWSSSPGKCLFGMPANNLDVLKELCSPRHAGYRLPQVKGMTGPPKKNIPTSPHLRFGIFGYLNPYHGHSIFTDP